MTMPLLILSIILPPLLHEIGHEIVARYYGCKPKWRIEFAFNIIPRGIWTIDRSKLTFDAYKNIKLAGFFFEYISVASLSLIIVNTNVLSIYYAFIMIGITLLHRILYPLYAGKYNDFDFN